MVAVRDLEVRHLIALREVARERNFGRAAVRLGYTQSAVSQQIAALERVLGGAVLERPKGPRPVECTPLGRVVLGHAEAVLERLDSAAGDVAAFHAGQGGTLSIGSFESVSVRILPHVLRRFRAGRPGVDLRLSETDDQLLIENQVRAGVVDVGFAVEPLDRGAFHVTPLLEDAFVLLGPPPSAAPPPGVPAGLADTTRPAVDVALLAGVPLISQTDSACQRLIEGGLRRAGLDPDIVFRTNDNAAVQAMVRAGVGYAVMPAFAVDTDDPDVVVRPLSPGIPSRTIAMITCATRTASPATEAFVAITREVVAALPPPRIGGTGGTGVLDGAPMPDGAMGAGRTGPPGHPD